MGIITLKSIRNISRVIDTGTRPVVVTCEDLNDYVCKHTYLSPSNSLCTEYLVGEFARIYGISIPEFNFVNISKEHIPEEYLGSQFQITDFEKECFGSLRLEYAEEISRMIIKDAKIKIKISNIIELLKIALYDLWTSNEDRNNNNYNLILNPEREGFRIYAIDHENCFNSNSLERGIYLISIDDSIISSELFFRLLKNIKNEIVTAEVDNNIKNLYLCREECSKQLDSIISNIPAKWHINTNAIKEQLNVTFLTDEWLKQVEQAYREYLQKYFNSK